MSDNIDATKTQISPTRPRLVYEAPRDICGLQTRSRSPGSFSLDRLEPAVNLRCHQVRGENDAHSFGEVRRNVVDEPTREANDVSCVGKNIEAIHERPSRLEVPLLLKPLVIVKR